MAYFVNSLIGVSLVDQMGNFFCRALLFMLKLLFEEEKEEEERRSMWPFQRVTWQLYRLTNS